jgi:hypothetical protein
MKEQRKITRRKFIGEVAGTAVTAGLGLGLADAAAANKSRVVLVRDENVLDTSGQADGKVIKRMLDSALSELTGHQESSQGWRSLIGSAKHPGVKTNAWSHLPTPPEVEQAIVSGLRSAGIKGEIPLTDRSAIELLSSCDALVNARPLRTHHWAGIGGCLKNCIMFVKEPWQYHPDNCVDLGKLYTLPQLAGKVKLHILAVLTPLFFGKGPHHFKREYVWPYKGLIVSRDPVAADAVGVRLLEAKRREFFGKETPLAHLAHHVEQADKKWGVGTATQAGIDLVKLGWRADSLI